jgi:hypothetical protein
MIWLARSTAMSVAEVLKDAGATATAPTLTRRRPGAFRSVVGQKPGLWRRACPSFA